MNRGFSLIEILLVIALAVPIIFVVANMNGNVNILNNLVSQQLQSKSDIAQTLQIMTTEVRSAGLAANGAYSINAAATGSFSFYSDINKVGVMDRVRYFFASSTIYKGVIAPTGSPATYPSSSEVVTDVIDSVIIPSSTPLFQYYDATYTGTQAPMTYPISLSGIRAVNVSFGADIKPQQAPGPQQFSTLIDIRNLRSN